MALNQLHSQWHNKKKRRNINIGLTPSIIVKFLENNIGKSSESRGLDKDFLDLDRKKKHNT